MVGERGLRKQAWPVFVLGLASDRAFGPPKRPCRAFCRTSNSISAEKNGRRERIRTSGPYVPNVVLYQAELLSDTSRERRAPRLGRRPYNHAPLLPPQPAKVSGRSYFQRRKLSPSFQDDRRRCIHAEHPNIEARRGTAPHLWA